MSSVMSARVPPRSRDPQAIRQHMRFVLLARAAARFVGEGPAVELARNVAGWDDEDASAAEMLKSIERRREHFGLVVSGGDAGAAAMAAEMFDAWRRATE